MFYCEEMVGFFFFLGGASEKLSGMMNIKLQNFFYTICTPVLLIYVLNKEVPCRPWNKCS